jgi:hypothetical protein
MRWAWILVVAIIVAFGAAWYMDFQRRQATIAEDSIKCEAYNRELGVLLSALRDNDQGRCAQLGEFFRGRCLAFLSSDPEKCSFGDSDCQVIASKTIDACFEPSCRAFITRDHAVCAELKGSALKNCRSIATLDAEGVVMSLEQCKADIASVI